MSARWCLLRFCVVVGVVWMASNQAVFASGPIALRGTLTILASGAGSPDDVAAAADDTIYFSDMGNNRIMQLKPGEMPTVVSPVINEPEGIVVLPDGSLIVVEQTTNRLYHLDPITQKLTLFYAVPNPTQNLGIDGLGYDPMSGDILIPDAPTGRILRLSGDAKQIKVIASGFERPTSVVLAADGTLYVCDEYGGAVYRLPPGGKNERIATMSLPDDVILEAGGTLIVNSLAGVIWRIDPVTRQATKLVIGLSSPHGIALDSAGNLIIADAIFNKIYRLTLVN